MANLNAIVAANQLLGDEAVPIPKMSDVYKDKNFHYLPTYALAISGIIGIVVIVVGAVIKNYPVCALGSLFTVSSGIGTYYSWKYLQTKPLEQQVEAMRRLVERTKKTTSDVNETLKSYQELEGKLKGNNKTLSTLVDEFHKGLKEKTSETQAQIDSAKEIVAKYEQATAELKKDKEYIDFLQNEITQISVLLADTIKATETFNAGLAELSKDNEKIQQSKAEIKSDVEAIDKENKEYAANRRALNEGLKVLKTSISTLLDSYKANKAVLDKQSVLLKQLYEKLDGLSKASNSEEKTSENLKNASDELQQSIDVFAQLLPLLKQYYEDQSKVKENGV